MIQDQTSIRSMTRRRTVARSTKAEKISRNADGHFSAVSLQRRLDAPSSILLLSLSSHVFVCARTFVLSPSVTSFSSLPARLV